MIEAASTARSLPSQVECQPAVLVQRLSCLAQESYDLANRRIANVHPHVRKSLGQYFTPPEIACFMAQLLTPLHDADHPVRILDAGAGTGILGLAAAQRLLTTGASSVEIVAVESDPETSAMLRDVLSRARELSYDRILPTVVQGNFLDHSAAPLLLPHLGLFHFVISNPPYFKMSPTQVVGGDAPNIYARFMEVASQLLHPQGQLCFIIPRSFASGFYFARFRRRLNEQLTIRHIHSFHSRSQAFSNQSVLQENVIVLYSRSALLPGHQVTISSSESARDLATPTVIRVPLWRVLHPNDAKAVIHIPLDGHDLHLMDLVKTWSFNLASLNLQVSTGPVVPFRSREYLLEHPCGDPIVPLLWMQHVKPHSVKWPIGDSFRKQEYIRSDAGPNLLVPNKRYILLRRFSAKEDTQRLTAAVAEPGYFPSASVGLENHLNFIHRPEGDITREEAAGLSVILNSRTVDSYLRIFNGNTQVGATDLRRLPLPSSSVISQIGRAALLTSIDRYPRILREVLDVED